MDLIFGAGVGVVYPTLPSRMWGLPSPRLARLVGSGWLI
jgi:hypothetical protein